MFSSQLGVGRAMRERANGRRSFSGQTRRAWVDWDSQAIDDHTAADMQDTAARRAVAQQRQQQQLQQDESSTKRRLILPVLARHESGLMEGRPWGEWVVVGRAPPSGR